MILAEQSEAQNSTTAQNFPHRTPASEHLFPMGNDESKGQRLGGDSAASGNSVGGRAAPSGYAGASSVDPDLAKALQIRFGVYVWFCKSACTKPACLTFNFCCLIFVLCSQCR